MAVSQPVASTATRSSPALRTQRALPAMRRAAHAVAQPTTARRASVCVVCLMEVILS
jgi:hypothetical protein